MPNPSALRVLVLALVFGTCSFPVCGQTSTAKTGTQLELSRAVRSWEFLDALGQQAGLFGRENGNFEGWVYPLKLFRNFHLIFHFKGASMPAEQFARTVTVRPESATILYANDFFSVRETVFVPAHERGAVVELEIDTFEPLEIEVGFERDFQIMWPAAIGGTYISWNDKLHAFALGEESRKYFGLIGSLAAIDHAQESSNNNFSSTTNSFRLSASKKGHDKKVIVIAASFKDQADLESTYQRLAHDHLQLQQQAADYHQQYLAKTVSLSLPDRDLQTAYDWSRVSTIQGLVDNPFLGTGLIAGYGTSGNGARPGFAWFFGRDSLWTDLALDAAGDFANVNTALEFISKYQREDGKIEHELSQSASLVPWFKDFPYGYASADATPLYIIAMDDYVTTSGDVEFGRRKWDSIWKAFQFLRSTYDGDGFPRNMGVGHGWVEGGPLLPVKTELYQSALGLAAVRALAHLAHLTGKNQLHDDLQQQFEKGKAPLNRSFWSPEKKSFVFALDKEGKRVDVDTVLSTVPMWMGVVDEDKADSTISRLADFDHSTDWGMRIISSENQLFDPTGYHFGSVWPLFTGWAAVGEYRYHRALPAYANLRANSMLAFNGSLGRVTEVLSGSYNTQLATSSPHQIWSSAMVVSPLLRGLLGFENLRTENRFRFAPHVPAGWTHFTASQVPACDGTLNLEYTRSSEVIELKIERAGTAPCQFEFAPSISPRAKVLEATVNGSTTKFQMDSHPADQHAVLPVNLAHGRSTLSVRIKDDFAVAVPGDLPEIGGTGRNLKITSETWNTNRDQVQLQVSGLPGHTYELSLYNSHALKAEQAELLSMSGDGAQRLRISFPASDATSYVHRTVTLWFSPPN